MVAFPVLGVDPGVSGALAFLYRYGDNPPRVAVYDMPVADGEVDPHGIAKLLADHQPCLAVVEKVHGMSGGYERKMGARTAFNFGASYAAACTAVALAGVPLTRVAPATWKKAARLPGGPEGKEAARAEALRLFPACAEHFARKRDHGRAEAALIALHGTRSS